MLFFTFTLLGTLLAGAISVQRAIIQAEDRLWQSIPALALLRSASNDWFRMDVPTPEMIEKMGNLPQVKTFTSTFPGDAVGKNIRTYISEGNAIRMAEREFNIDRPEALFLWGTTNGRVAEFESGLLRLSEGRFWDAGDEQGILISRQVATVNHLSVGSTFPMSTYIVPGSPHKNPFDDDSPKNIFEVEVIGIFELVHDFDSGHRIFDDQRRDQILNTIFMPAAFAMTLGEQAVRYNWVWTFPDSTQQDIDEAWEMTVMNSVWNNTIFFLYDGRDMENFRHAALEFLPPLWEVRDYSEIAFPQMLGAMGNMSDLANFILWGAIGATSLITILLVFLYLKDIKQEIGIYLALGEKKFRIVLKIMSEVGIVAIASLSLSILLGNQLANGLSYAFLQNELIEQGPNSYVEWGSFSQMCINCAGWAFDFHNPTDMSMDEMLAAYDVSLGANTVFIIFAVGMSAIILATGIASLYIWRLPPKDILIAVN